MVLVKKTPESKRPPKTRFPLHSNPSPTHNVDRRHPLASATTSPVDSPQAPYTDRDERLHHSSNLVHASIQHTSPRQFEAWGSASQAPELSHLISLKLDAILTSIDGESFDGDERDLFISQGPQLRGGSRSASRDISKGADQAISSAITSTNYFAKVNLYANSRLPPNLPPMKLYLPAYSLVCLAAKFSQKVYSKPTGQERESHVDGSWRMGTKAMVIKSVPVDDINVLIFAIRGSQTFMDWAVNINSAPVSPGDFLDDPGNLCHSGFLSVARKMIKPVAARLRSLLEEDPSRSSSSLLFTGHSAGGAVASLLYAHMLAKEVQSELSIIAGCFQRIHCITFGTPPLSLLPLAKPLSEDFQESLFLSFINEGDPVPRADKAYVWSLIDLYTSPAPSSSEPCKFPASASKLKIGSLIPSKRSKLRDPINDLPPTTLTPLHQTSTWRVPPAILSNGGSLIVLRTKEWDGAAVHLEENIQAELTTDEQLREVIFGNPLMHMMKAYARRVEVLATRAFTARLWS